MLYRSSTTVSTILHRKNLPIKKLLKSKAFLSREGLTLLGDGGLEISGIPLMLMPQLTT